MVRRAPQKGEPQRPREEALQLTDGSATFEAKSLESLAVQRRQRYPDEACQRSLHREQDLPAEERRRDAMNLVIGLLAEEAVKAAVKEEGGSKRRSQQGQSCHPEAANSRSARAGLLERHGKLSIPILLVLL